MDRRANEAIREAGVKPQTFNFPLSEPGSHSGVRKSSPNLEGSLFNSLFDPPTEDASPSGGEVVDRDIDTIQIHPSLEKLNLRPGEEHVLKLTRLGRPREDFPIVISPEGWIIVGTCYWLAAKRRGERCIRCLEIAMSKDDSLRQLIFCERQIPWLNAFCRIELALELKKWVQERARAHQIAGGQKKGLSRVTDPERIDTRRYIAGIAGVSTGNVTKVENILKSACGPLITALQNGSISIHRGALLSRKVGKEQEQEISKKQHMKVSASRNRRLLSKHRSQRDETGVYFHQICSGLRGLGKLETFSDLHPKLERVCRFIDELLTEIDSETAKGGAGGD